MPDPAVAAETCPLSPDKIHPDEKVYYYGRAGKTAIIRFEKIHEETYRDFGFELISVETKSLAERVSLIKATVR